MSNVEPFWVTMNNIEPFWEGILCTKCYGQALPLGKIGKLNHYKCRDCRMDYAYENSPKNKDKSTSVNPEGKINED